MSDDAPKSRGGRPRLFAEPLWKISIRVTREQQEKARRLGQGDISAGIRKALDSYKEE